MEQRPTWIDVMQGKWWIGVVSLLVSLGVTPILRQIAGRAGRGHPEGELYSSSRERSAAYLGSLAICIGLLAGLGATLAIIPKLSVLAAGLWEALATGSFIDLLDNPLWNLMGIAAASVLVTVVAMLGDLSRIGRRRVILGQVLAAVVLLLGGVGAKMGVIVLSYVGVSHASWTSVLPVSAVMCVALVVAMTNASKILGDLDGLCSGVTAIVTLSFLALATWLATWGNFLGQDQLRVGLCLAMAGALLGFLPYNIPPAKVLLGNGGGMLQGFFVATMMAMFCLKGHPRWLIASFVVFAMPILDSGIAVVRRIRGGKSIFAQDRSHLHHQLLDRGMTIGQVVTVYYVMSLLAGVLGVVVAEYVRLRYALPIYALLLAGLLIVAQALGFFTPEHARGKLRSTGFIGPLNLLFTCVGRRVALLQEFRRAAIELDVELVIHAADHSELAPALQEADRTLAVPKVDDPKYVPTLVEYCRQNGIRGLIPLIDPELLPLAEAKQQLADAGTRAVVSSPRVVRICLDKGLTGEFLASHGFKTPHILTPQELESPRFPLFGKPRCGSASIDAHKITDAEGLAYYLHRLADTVIQEYVEGVEYTVDVFVDFDGKAGCAVPRRRLAVLGGEVSKGQVEMHPRIMEESCRLVEALGHCEGMITVQCFLTPGDEILFTEVNPRFGGGVPLSIRAGADSPRWLMELLMGRKPSVAMRGWTDGLMMLRYDRAVYVHPDDQTAK